MRFQETIAEAYRISEIRIRIDGGTAKIEKIDNGKNIIVA